MPTRGSTWNVLPPLLLALGAGWPGPVSAQDGGPAAGEATPRPPRRLVAPFLEAGLGLGAHRALFRDEPAVEFAAVSDVSAGLRLRLTSRAQVGAGFAAHLTASRYGAGQVFGLEALTRVTLRSGAAVSGSLGLATGVDSGSPSDVRLARLVLEPSEGFGLALEGVSTAREHGATRDWGVMAGVRFGGRPAIAFAALHALVAAGAATR